MQWSDWLSSLSLVTGTTIPGNIGQMMASWRALFDKWYTMIYHIPSYTDQEVLTIFFSGQNKTVNDIAALRAALEAINAIAVAYDGVKGNLVPFE